MFGWDHIKVFHFCSLEYLKAVKSTASMNVEELKSFSYKYDDVYFHPVSKIGLATKNLIWFPAK